MYVIDYSITGLACKNNKTLSLLALDSEMYHYIAERMGVHILDIENKTAALIIDNEVSLSRFILYYQ